MKKYKEDINSNELFEKIKYLSNRSFHDNKCLNYELDIIRKESVESRVKTAKEIRLLCENISKDEILDLITLGYK